MRDVCKMLGGSAGLTLDRAGRRFVIPRRCDESFAFYFSLFISTRSVDPSPPVFLLF